MGNVCSAPLSITFTYPTPKTKAYRRKHLRAVEAERAKGIRAAKNQRKRAKKRAEKAEQRRRVA